MPETQYVETEALLAVLNGDDEALLQILRGMTDNERVALRHHAAKLSSRIADLDHPVWDWAKRTE